MQFLFICITSFILFCGQHPSGWHIRIIVREVSKARVIAKYFSEILSFLFCVSRRHCRKRVLSPRHYYGRKSIGWRKPGPKSCTNYLLQFCPLCSFFSKSLRTFTPLGTFSTRISTRMALSRNGRIVTLSNIREFENLTYSSIRIVWVVVASRKCFAEAVNGIQTNRFLYMQVMFRHAYICMSHNTLDCR